MGDKSAPGLSETAQAAIEVVPTNWERIPLLGVRFGRHRASSVLFDRTFEGLKRRGLIEFRGAPGDWEWRRRDPRRSSEQQAVVDRENHVWFLSKQRRQLAEQLAQQRAAATDTERRLAEIDAELSAASRSAD